jgi:hypothetical protein
MREPPPDRKAQPEPMEEMRTEHRQRDDPDACEYVPPGVEAFCRPYPAIVARSFSPGASRSGRQPRRYRLKEPYRSL